MLQELDVLAGDVTVNIPSAEGTQGGEGKGEGEGEGEGDEGKSKSSAASAVEEDAPPPALPRFVRQFSLDECGSSFRDPFDLPALPALSKHISIEERREARDQNASRSKEAGGAGGAMEGDVVAVAVLVLVCRRGDGGQRHGRTGRKRAGGRSGHRAEHAVPRQRGPHRVAARAAAA